MAMAGTTFIRLLLVLLCFSQLFIFLDAIPTTRTRSLELRSHGNTKHDFMRNKIVSDMNLQTVVKRMVVELNDYPGSGANNRHTPRPQFQKSCVDC